MTTKLKVFHYIKANPTADIGDITTNMGIKRASVVSAIRTLKRDSYIRSRVKGYGYVILTTL